MPFILLIKAVKLAHVMSRVTPTPPELSAAEKLMPGEKVSWGWGWGREETFQRKKRANKRLDFQISSLTKNKTKHESYPRKKTEV